MGEGVMSVSDLKKQKESLARQEKTTGNSGAVPNTPKQMLLDGTDIQEKNPEHHVRWVNIKDPQKAAGRQAEGYERVPMSEGGRQLGDELAAFRIPTQGYEARLARQEKLNEHRLSSHKVEAERMAEGIARELRDRHGIHVSAERILNND